MGSFAVRAGQESGQGAPPAPLWAAARRLLCYPRALDIVRRTRVGTSPCDVVHERGTHRLLRYRRESQARYVEPVLFCYALINRPYILDLRAGKSVVQRYLERGFDVYIVDWGVPSHADRRFTLEHYVSFLHECVRAIRAHSGGPPVHLVGYCMGGTISTILTSLHPREIQTLTLLAAPIDFSTRESLLNVWSARECFDVDAFVDTHGNAPAWFLQACFLSLKPVQFVQKNLSLWENLEDSAFLESFFAMELWVNDNIPVAGETFREFVKAFYQENRLVHGEFRLAGRPVDLGELRCPLLLLAAKADHLVPPCSTAGLLPHVRSTDVQSVVADAGHVGLIVSGKTHSAVWPAATRWLAERSTDVTGVSGDSQERTADSDGLE
ncbi:MAG: alpha/beta fold hydrolase [Myxococcales bacterium]|nr:alpha/beta fold hydrolase [Myxococcales bacterium]